MKIWILQTGESLHVDGENIRPMRAVNLSNTLVEKGHEVILWSTRFNHTKKQQRNDASRIRISNNLEIRLLHSPGYKTNLGIKRIIDHLVLGWNLRKTLRMESKPDIAFIGYPPIETAFVLTMWLQKRSTPIMLDIKDAWPHIFYRALPQHLKLIGKVLVLPYELMFRYILRKSDCISAVSPPFLDWCLGQANRKINNFDRVTYLSSEITTPNPALLAEGKQFWNELGISNSNKILCTYVGSLTSILDFNQICDVAEKGLIDLVIAGEGPILSDLKLKWGKCKNIHFPGWINSYQIVTLAEISDLLLSPYKSFEDFEMALPNKFIDAMQLGLPMITSLNGYARQLLEENNIGQYFSLEDNNSFKNLIEKIYEHPEKLIQMGNKARNVYLSRFENRKVYGDLVESLEKLRNANISSKQ